MPIVTLTESPVEASTLIKRAMRLIGQLSPGEEPDAYELADGLEGLNALLDSWRNKRLMCYALRDESVSMVSGQPVYTIGPASDIDTNRPVAIEFAYIVVGDQTYDVQILDELQWASIPDKSKTSDWPDKVYYQADSPIGALYVHPVPTAAAVLHILDRIPLLAFASSSDTTYLPPGWAEALATNLAINFAPEFKTQASPTVMKMAEVALAGIRTVNSRPFKANTGLVGLLGRHRSNIITDRP